MNGNDMERASTKNVLTESSAIEEKKNEKKTKKKTGVLNTKSNVGDWKSQYRNL